ncbi:MAG: serine/threonine-protein kinase [Kofleriaceae bacterium]
MQSTCPGEQTLVQYVEGMIEPPARAEVIDHMASCLPCRDTIGGLMHVAAPQPTGALARYRMDRVVGAGGMGVVVAAHDTELDRPVAIKLAHAASRDEASSARLIREARALAQLTHPNVITIYDAGIVGDELFIVMELVEGGTLGEWLRRERRGWRAIVEVFLAAGRGLAAAHERDLIHRDFKPSNVLLGADMRPRVSDFGLVRVAGQSDEPRAAMPIVVDRNAVVTATGSVLGTPGYMAPEQIAGGVVDARSDQYAFCRSLHGALFDQPRADAFSGGARGRVPATVRRALERGMQTDPERRFANIGELLGVLERSLRHTKRLLAGAAMVLGLTAIGYAALTDPSAPSVDVCSIDSSSIWSTTEHDAVRQHLLSEPKSKEAPRIIDALSRFDRTMSRYAANWSQTASATCRAARTAGEAPQADSPSQLCLDRQRSKARSLVTALNASPKLATLLGVTSDALGLEPSAQCEALPVTQPKEFRADPDYPQAAVLRDQLYAVRIAMLEQPAKGGVAIAERVANAAHQLRLDRLYAEALQVIAHLYSDAGEGPTANRVVQNAIEAATAVHDDLMAADAYALAAYVQSSLVGDLKAARASAKHAEELLQRSRAPQVYWARYYGYLGVVELSSGDYAAAEGSFRTAAKVREAIKGDSDRLISQYELGAVVAQRAMGRLSDARKTAERALGRLRTTLGNSHPDVADALQTLGVVARLQRDFAAAHTALAESVAIYEALDPSSPGTGESLAATCAVMIDERRFDDAQPLCDRALAIKRKHPKTPHFAIILNYIAIIASEQNRPEAAEAAYLEAIALATETYGPDSDGVASSQYNLGNLRLGRGDFKGARTAINECLRIYRHIYGNEHQDIATVYHLLGMVAVGEHNPRRAVREFERALAMMIKIEPVGWWRARIEFDLARALRSAGLEPRRAIALARNARAGFEGNDPELVAKVDAWLKRRS